MSAADLGKLLEGFLKLDGVTGAFIVNGQGDLLNKVTTRQVDEASMIRTALRSLDLGSQIERLSGRGGVVQSYLEFGSGHLTVEAMNEALILIVAASPGTNLGRIRYEIRRSKKTLEAG